MANVIREQRLIDSTKRALLKYTMLLDTAAANSTLVDVSTLQYALNANGRIMTTNTDPKSSYGTTIKRIYGAVKANTYIKLQWHGDSNSEIVILPSGRFNYSFDAHGDSAVITNPEANSSGDILISVITPSSTDAATIFIDLKKDNRDYDAGQSLDPIAFNR